MIFLSPFFSQWSCAVFFGITKCLLFSIVNFLFRMKRNVVLFLIFFSFFPLVSMNFSLGYYLNLKFSGNMQTLWLHFFFSKCKQFSKGFNQSLSAHSVETPAANDCCKVVFFLYFSHLLHAYHIDPTKNLIEQHGSNYFKLNTYMYAQFGVDVC